nr:reverse transcriptase domain-containing protein [Tanacetum cinerariifolium]
AVEIAAVGISIAIFNQVSKVAISPFVSITTSFVVEEETIGRINNEAVKVQITEKSSMNKEETKELTQDDVKLENLENGSTLKEEKKRLGTRKCGGKPPAVAKPEHHRLSSDTSHSNSNAYILRRWSGASDMSIDLSGEKNLSSPSFRGKLSSNSGQSGALVGRGSAYNHDLRTWACLADFRCLAEVSSKSLRSVLLPPDFQARRPAIRVIRHQVPQSSMSIAYDVIACAFPARFPWHTAKNVTRDPAPVAADFNAQDYATLVAHPSPFWKFLEEFLCLVRLSRHYTLDEKTYPLFLDKDGDVKVIERERKNDEPRLLETTVGRTVPLLSVAPERDEIEPDASVDKLFLRAVVPPRRNKEILPVVRVDKASKEKETIIADAGGPSHPPKKFREDHGTLSGASVGGKSRSVVQRLFAGVVKNDEAGGEGHIDSITGLNLRTINAPQRFIISSDSSHHSGANIVEAEVDSFARPSVSVIIAATSITSTVDPAVVVIGKIVKPYLFSIDSTSAGGTDPAMGGFTNLTCSDFLVGGIHTVTNPDSDLQKIYVPWWNVTNGFRLNDGGVFHEMVDEFTPNTFLHLAEVRMRAEYNIREKRRLESVVEEKNQLLKARDEEIENLKAQMLLKEAEVAKVIHLGAEASNFKAVEKSLWDKVNALNGCNTILEKERNALDVKVMDLKAAVVHELQVSSSRLKEKLSNYENLTERLKELHDAHLKVVNDKFDKLYIDFVEMTLHMEERFYPCLLTTIAGHRWLITYGMELAIVKCLNSPEYLFALGTSISKAIENGMQDGLAAGITHGKKGRVLTDVVAYKPSAKIDYVSALQQLQSVNFPLLAELKSNKDVSIEALMKIIHLEERLAKRLGLNESQPHADQLMVPIHHSSDKTVFGAFALLLALDISDAWVRRALLILRPLLPQPYRQLFSASSSPPISTDDYEVVRLDGQEGAGAESQGIADGNADPFANIDDVDLNRSRLISKASLFCTMSTSTVFSVGMPISAEMTASVSYVNENEVSPLLDFIIVCPATEPPVHDDPSVNKIHGLGSSSSSVIRVSGESSSAFMPPLVLITPVVMVVSLSVIKTALTVSFAAARIQLHVNFSYSFEHLFYISDYLILRAVLDNKVIYIYFEVSANLFMECFVYQALVGGSGIPPFSLFLAADNHLLDTFCLSLYSLRTSSDYRHDSSPLLASCPRFFCITGEHPSRTFRRCSVMCLGTPVMSVGFHVKMSKLVYEKACHVPIELEHQAYWALKWTNFNLKIAGNHRKVQLNELNKLQDRAYKNSLIYKEKTKKIHDAKIKNREFHIGDHVLLFNSRLNIFSDKLKSRWSGPFTIIEVFPYGTVELSQPNGPKFNVNGHRIKHYHGGDIPTLDVPDLHLFPKDN